MEATLPSPKRSGLVSRFSVAELGVLMRDGRHIGHECSGMLARGVSFGHPAAGGIRRMGLHVRNITVLRAAVADTIVATASGD